MSDRLRAMAHETMAIIRAGGYQGPSGREVRLADGVAAAMAGTRLYIPGQPIIAPSLGEGPVPVVEVRNETSLAAARRLGDEVACLVLASARNPGGGFLNGAQAQEESIARSSALYHCQTSPPAREFYDPGSPARCTAIG